MINFFRFWVLYSFLLISSPSFAQGSTYNIGTSTATWGQGITQFLQEVADLIGGPIVAFIVLAALIFAILAWVIDPRGQGLAWAFRAVIGGAALATSGAIMTSIGFSGGGGGVTFLLDFGGDGTAVASLGFGVGFFS